MFLGRGVVSFLPNTKLETHPLLAVQPLGHLLSQLNPSHSLKTYLSCLSMSQVAQLVETLHYKPEGRGFDSR
jgi:predicted Zn-dependent protease